MTALRVCKWTVGSVDRFVWPPTAVCRAVLHRVLIQDIYVRHGSLTSVIDGRYTDFLWTQTQKKAKFYHFLQEKSLKRAAMYDFWASEAS